MASLFEHFCGYLIVSVALSIKDELSFKEHFKNAIRLIF